MSSHAKKRNSALLYEFLVKFISQSLVDGDKKKSNAAFKIIKKHFKQGTEIYKEFRLLNALAQTSVSSEHVASNILFEAKAAARTHDVAKLDKEKRNLLSDIINSIKDNEIFEQHIDEYKKFDSSGIA